MRIEISTQRFILPRHAAVCVLYLLAGWAFFAPPKDWARSGSGLTYFGQGQDPLAFIWFLNWWPFAWAHHLPLLFTQYADAPLGTDLVWKTSVPALALLAAPVTLHFGPAASFNLLMIACAPLSAFGVYLAAFELTGRFAPAILAGLLFGISGYEIGQGQGHLNLAFCIAVPLCLWACLRAARCNWSAWRLGVVLGALLSFEFGVSQEVFTSLLLFGGATVFLVFWLNKPARGAVLALSPGMVLSLALCLALISPFLLQMLRLYALERNNLSAPGLYGNDLLSFVTPTPLSLLGGTFFMPVTVKFLGNYTEQGGYFSAPLLMLLGCIAWRAGAVARVAGLLLLLSASFSLGPFLFLLGRHVSRAPWALVYKSLPFLTAILPCRMVLYGWLAAAMLIAIWLAEPGAGWRRYAPVAACLAILAPDQSFARNWTHLPVPNVFATLKPGARVLVLPEFGQEMGWQVAAHMQFTLTGQGYLGTGRPAGFSDWPLFEPLWENQFAAINPTQFAAYLTHYNVDDLIILPQGYNLFHPQTNQYATFQAAQSLAQKAGWHIISSTPDAVVLRPAGGDGVSK